MENQELIENTKKITNFSKTKDFYNAYKLPLSPDTDIAQATFYILFNSDPVKETSRHEIDKRGIALKILERITVEKSQQYDFLHKIILFDDTPNVILATKCVQTFFIRRILRQEDYLKFLDTVCKKVITFIKDFCTENLQNAIQFMNFFAFVFDLTKICNVFNDSINDLIIEIEKFSALVVNFDIKEAIKKNQLNYTIFKFLNFVCEMNPIYKKDDLIIKLSTFLMKNVNDESKELLFLLQNKLAVMSEKIPDLIKDYSFFLKSDFLDVKANGIKNLLRSLKIKENTKHILEEVQIKIVVSAKELFYTKEELNENDVKTLIVLLESLIAVNKFYSKEHISMIEKKNFRRFSLNFTVEFLKEFTEKIKKIFGKNEEHEFKKQKNFEEMFSNCFNVVLKGFEDSIAFTYGQEVFTLDLPPLSTKELFYDDFCFFEQILHFSFEIFSLKFLRIFLERYFALFIYSSYNVFYTLIKKYTEKILSFTCENPFFFDAWNVFLDNNKSAGVFANQVYSIILRKFVPKDFERNMNIRKYNEEYSDLLSCPILLDNSDTKIPFYIKALKKVLAKDKHNPIQLEKIFTTIPFYYNFQVNLEILNCIFDCIKPCYNEFTTVPKLIYEKVTFLLDILHTLHLKMPDREIFIKLALNIPLSLNLVLQHFPKLAYFIAEGIQINNELKTISYNILEKSLDSINTEFLKIIPSEIFEKITKTLLIDSTEEPYALAAMQILLKYHSSLKIFINFSHLIIDSIYPRGMIYLQLNQNQNNVKFHSDFLIKDAITNIKGENIKETNSKVYSVTGQLYSFRRTITKGSKDLISKKLLIAFLYNTFGWENFENEAIYKKASSDLTAILDNNYSIEPNLNTQLCSHQARVKNIYYTTLLRHQQYVYDALLSLYILEEEEFLFLTLNVLFSYRLIAFYRLAPRKSKVYFNYKILLKAFYESFSFIPLKDYFFSDCFEFNICDDDSLKFFYKNEEYLFDYAKFKPEEELENFIKDFLPYKILKRNFDIFLKSGFTLKMFIESNVVNDILDSFTSLSFYKDEKKQKSFILGISTLLINLKEEKEWLSKNFSKISASLLFCMSESNPKYKNLILLIFMFLMERTKDYNIQLKDVIVKPVEKKKFTYATDMLHLQRAKTLPRKDIIEQLFDSLYSKHKKLRMISLQALVYYSELKKIPLSEILFSYCQTFYTNLNTKYTNSNSRMKLGFFDCLLLLNKIIPYKKTNNLLNHFSHIVINTPFVFYYDNLIILLKVRKFIIEEGASEEIILSNIDYIVKNISSPIFEAEKIIKVCKEIISFLENPSILQKHFKKNFVFYFSDKSNLKHYSSTVFSIVKIFPSCFTDELIYLTFQHLPDYYDESSCVVFQLIYYLEKIPDNFYNVILNFFSSMPCNVDDNFMKFLLKHNNFLDFMIFNCKEFFVFFLLKNVIFKVKKSKNSDYQLLYNNILSILKKTSIFNIVITEKIINFGLLLSFCDYDFKKEELIYLFKSYNRNLLCYFYDFYELNKEKLHEITLPNDFNFKDDKRNKAFIYFEKKIYDEEYLKELQSKEDLIFDELCYLALYKPTYKIYKELFFYEENPTRIFEILKRIPLTDEINEVILYTFENSVAYRIHLFLLMPLLIEFPNLINKQNLQKVLETIHRLFGTNSFQHKFTAGKLLYACSQNVKEKELLFSLYTQFFNFCIKCSDKEYFNLFKSIDLKLLDDFDFIDVDFMQLALCLDFLIIKFNEEKKKNTKKIKKNKKIYHAEKEIYQKLFNHLLPHLNDNLFFTSFLEFFTLEEINYFISQPKMYPKISYHCILLAYKEKLVDHSLIITALETIIELFKNPSNDLLFIDFQKLIQKYSYKKDIQFLKILGLLSECCEDYFVYEHAILFLESFDDIENKSVVENESEIEFNFKEVENILKNYFFKKSNISESFLNFLIYIFRNEKFKKFYEELKPFFVKGLESKFEYLKDEFHEMLKDTLPKDKSERLKYLLGMDWNLFENNFVYTFFRLMLDEEVSFNLLSQYSTGNDHFYETIYKKKKEKKQIEQTLNREIFFVTYFRDNSIIYKPENVTKIILDFCFTNKETCVKILAEYLKSLKLTNFKEEFKLFALNLNINKFNSFLIDNLFSVFNYLLIEVRIKHNCYFSNIGSLEDEEKYLIYKLTEEYEYYLASYKSMFYLTQECIKELLLSNFEKSRILLQKCFEMISDENFNEKECLFLEENWKYSMKNLCQWEALLEVAIQTNDVDLECEVSFFTRDTGNIFLESVLRKKDSFEKFVYECINNPFDQDVDSLLFLAQLELSQIPFYTPRFVKMLNYAQAVFEVKELQTLKKENLSDQRSLWSKREPLSIENILNWIFFFSWRCKLFNFINKDDNIIFLQELSSLMNKITCLSRNMNLLETAEYFNQMIYATPNIRSTDAFTKIIEEIEILIKRNEHDLALKRAKTTNISYFNNDQRGIILYYIAKLERNNTNFNNAAQLCNTNSKNWNEWGIFLQETNGEIENICASFIKAAMYATKENYKYFVKCVKYFNDDKMYEILKENINFIDPSAYISLIPSLEAKVTENRNKCARLCLVKLGEVIPQTCFRRFKTYASSNSDNNSTSTQKKENISSNETSKEKKTCSGQLHPLEEVYNEIKFETNKCKLGLVMIISLCSSRILITHEQLAHSCLERIFYSCPNKFIHKNIDLTNTFTRMFKCVNLTNWNSNLINDFLSDFENYMDGERDSPSVLMLKCYKWLNTIENILRTYISSHDLDLSTCRLIDNLLEYELVLFGKDEFRDKIFIDHFLPTSTFYMSEKVMSRTLSIIGSDGKEYLYLTQNNQDSQSLYEETMIVLINYLSLDLKSTNKCYQASLNYKTVVTFANNFDLIFFEEPFVILGVIYEESLKKSLRRLFIDYLIALQEVSNIKLDGFENVDKYINAPVEEEIYCEESNLKNESNSKNDILDEPGNIVFIYKEKDRNSKNVLSLESGVYLRDYLKRLQADDSLSIDANHEFFGEASFTNEHKLKAYKKICNEIDDKLLFKGFTDIYGKSDKFFRFRKKFTINYAFLAIYSRMIKFIQLSPFFTGICLFSGSIKILSFDLNHNSSSLLRLSPNVVNLISKEGLEGLFVSTADNFLKFIFESEFAKDYIDNLTFLSYEDAKADLERFMDGKIVKLIEKSMNPEELCKRDISWYPWL
ncbi:PIK-related kinase [Tubulinosema ratisbonensis]|uniref:PIK-related kinase n=1 Tax=Tubulinosema ratisbonensis TaxID=291195 RepID=A0A437AHZ4_9MICR|nr:PIK-related kinase [Tubulinosema ratisbonensis]